MNSVHIVFLIIGGFLESPLWLLLAFCPTFLEADGDLQIVLCNSINVGSLVVIP